ncbi:MAG: hypothetical protein AAF664_03195 [Planctomycetota bacterium]
MSLSKILTLVAVLLATGAVSSAFAGELTVIVDDDFETSQHSIRKAVRGDWKIEGGTAKVIQDDETYKKFKNHGPMLTYEVEHKDLGAVIEFKPLDCKRVVFTFDAIKGHAFRVILRADQEKGRCTIQTYTAKENDQKAKPIILDDTLPRLREDKWHRLQVQLNGSRASVVLDDRRYEVEHARIDQAKRLAKLSFAFGEIEVRKFELTR